MGKALVEFKKFEYLRVTFRFANSAVDISTGYCPLDNIRWICYLAARYVIWLSADLRVDRDQSNSCRLATALKGQTTFHLKVFKLKSFKLNALELNYFD